MNDNRNLILAMVLSIAILFGWAVISEEFFPQPQPTPTPASEAVSGDERDLGFTPPVTDPAADTATATRERSVVLAEAPRIPIVTPALRGSINLQGARIDDLLLTRHREDVDRDSPSIRLFSPSGAPQAYFAQYGWTGEGELPDAETIWQADAERLTPDSPVTLSWTNSAQQTFQIRLSIDENYLFTAEQRILNRGSLAIVARPYGLVARNNVPSEASSWTMHVGPMGVFGGRTEDVDYEDIIEEGGRVDFSSTGGWLGFSDKYWLAALIAPNDVSFQADFRGYEGNRYQAGVRGDPVAVGPGASAATTLRLFAGAKEVDVLEHYQDDLGIPRIESAIDWGWFDFIAKPIFHLLDWLYGLIGNYGVAIICLTILIRLVLFPIANKQYESMAKMRAVQPKMKALQDRHKDDRMKLQQEMMALYKTEKVNPMAGCLPILLQIPIFYALYKVLMLAIDVRHQPFMLWIRDLSAPDPLTPVNLFGLLDFNPPPYIGIGVLPILLGVTMWLQMRLNPQPMDEIQKKVFGFLPWIFMIIMAPFAAGLQLYWTVNNLISIGQQWILIRKHPAPQGDAAPAKAAKAK